MAEYYYNFINGEWKKSVSGAVLESINPANEEEIVGFFQDSNESDLNEAVLAAKNAQFEWKKISYIERGEYLHKVATLMEENTYDIAVTATKEMGKTLAETTGEVKRSISILRYYAQEAMQSVGQVVPSANGKNMLYTTRTPLGVVGVIAPWNFPIAIPIWKIAPSLVYGNTVVLKSAAETTITANKIIQLFDKAELPKGVINMVCGRGSTVGEYLINHHDVNAISFTGSNTVGKHIASCALSRGAKYQLELGGKNPTIILNDAKIDQAVQLTVDAAMKHTGQKCTATSRVLIQESIYEEVKGKIIDRVKEIKVGDGMNQDVYMGPLASKGQLNTVLKYIEIGKEEGATLLYGGERILEGGLEKGYFVQPTVFENVHNNMRIAQEEIFGPLIALIKVKDLDDAIAKANDVTYGLSAALFTTNLEHTFEFVERIEAGQVKVNGESSGSEPHVPFGGLKESSSHSREQGKSAIEFFTSIKTVTITP